MQLEKNKFIVEKLVEYVLDIEREDFWGSYMEDCNLSDNDKNTLSLWGDDNIKTDSNIIEILNNCNHAWALAAVIYYTK